jgi:hypothetical protein
MGYYDEKIKELEIAVDNCQKSVPLLVQYFLKEANAHTSGIPKEVEKEVGDLSSRFFSLCDCRKKEEEGHEPPSKYEGGPYFSETGIVRGYSKKHISNLDM